MKAKIIILILSLAAFNYITGVIHKKNVTNRYITNSNVKWRECYANETRCSQTRECIHNTEICDGKYDCKDSTDEGYFCLETIDSCPSYLFRCGYGACIDRTLECNGIPECIVDSSDEQTKNCPGVTWLQTCGYGKFTCKNGECIDIIHRCNGRKNCVDGSDECFAMCHEDTCNDFSFRCGYGACVHGNAKCDQIVDCEGDGSDEVQEICGYAKPIYNETCKYPDQPNYGSWTIYGIDNNHKLPYPGEEASRNTSLIFKCNKNYYLHPNNNVVHCKNGTWDKNFPKCYSTCPARISRLVNIECTFQDEKINCLLPVPHGTIANMSCPPFYKAAENQITSSVCDGTSWDTEIIECDPICGREIQKANPVLIKSKIAKEGEFPWHVAIYHKPKEYYTYKCGGSIITLNIILSAAHCFSDLATGKSYPSEEFFIGAGKFYSTYNDSRDKESQLIPVQNIYLGENYKGNSIHHMDDIAVVVLKDHFKITRVTQPVCIDWNEKYLDKHFTSKYPAHIVGWGKTTADGYVSHELRKITVPYQLRTNCYNKIPTDFLAYYTGDKFCAGDINGPNLCSGDSGGGLVFYEQKIRTYFLRGIASVLADKNQMCNHKYPGLYANINEYLNFIKNIIKMSRTNK